MSDQGEEMLTGYYTNISGIFYNEQKLAVTGNNIANVDTSGFRKSSLLMRTRESNPFTKTLDRAVAKRNPTEYGIQRSGVYKNYKKPGTLKHTGSNFDVAIDPSHTNAFFSVQKAGDPEKQTFYTRNGTLSIGPQDPKNPDSPSILKIAGHIALDDAGQAIEIDPSQGELRITGEGGIFQGENSIGELPIYRFNKSADPTSQVSANLQTLEQLGDSLYKIPKQWQEEFHPFRVEVGKNGIKRLMTQGSQESSNVNIFSELTEMLNATRGASANQTALRKQLDSLNKLFQLVRK